MPHRHTTGRRRIAIVGGGVTGLVAAHHLSRRHEIRLFEATGRLGGHARAEDVRVDEATFPIETGFTLHDERADHHLSALLHRLGVETVSRELSVSITDERAGVAWCPTSRWRRPRPVGSRPLSPAAHAAHLALVARIPRFHRAASQHGADLASGRAHPDETMREMLARVQLPPSFGEGYVVPLIATVWTADPTTVLEHPAATICRFLHDHGMLVETPPAWHTIVGGSPRYVKALSAPIEPRVQLKAPITAVRRRAGGGVDVRVAGAPPEPEMFDAVVLAVPAPIALRVTADADEAERDALRAIRTRTSSTVIHTDARVLPRDEAAWAAWNVHLPALRRRTVAVTYLANRLQPVPVATPVCVSLNRDDDIDPDRVLARVDHAYPVLDGDAVRAQRRLPSLQGRGGLWWAGSWMGTGTHEDAVRSAEQVCEGLDPGVTAG